MNEKMNWIRDKMYVTRDGKKMRLICTDLPGPYPLAFMDEHGELVKRTIDGHFMLNEYSRLDVTQEQQLPSEYWLNVYQNGHVTAHASADDASLAACRSEWSVDGVHYNYELVSRMAMHVRAFP